MVHVLATCSLSVHCPPYEIQMTVKAQWGAQWLTPPDARDSQAGPGGGGRSQIPFSCSWFHLSLESPAPGCFLLLWFHFSVNYVVFCYIKTPLSLKPPYIHRMSHTSGVKDQPGVSPTRCLRAEGGRVPHTMAKPAQTPSRRSMGAWVCRGNSSVRAPGNETVGRQEVGRPL